MTEPERAREMLLLWSRPFRFYGTCAAPLAAERLRTQLGAARFGFGERLVGSFDGERLRAWRRAPAASFGDTVEFDGRLRDERGGCAIEGAFRYTLATRVQFIGFLALGLALAGAGLLQWLEGAEQGGGILALGAFIFGATAAWVFSSDRMKEEQIDFIKSRLQALAAV